MTPRFFAELTNLIQLLSMNVSWITMVSLKDGGIITRIVVYLHLHKEEIRHPLKYHLKTMLYAIT